MYFWSLTKGATQRDERPVCRSQHGGGRRTKWTREHTFIYKPRPAPHGSESSWVHNRRADTKPRVCCPNQMDPRKHFHLRPGPKRYRGPLAPLRTGAEITSAPNFIYCLNQHSIPMSHVYHAGSLPPLPNIKRAVCVCMHCSTYTFISPYNCTSSNSIPISTGEYIIYFIS